MVKSFATLDIASSNYLMREKAGLFAGNLCAVMK